MTLRDEYLGLVVETRGLSELHDDWDGEGSAAPKLINVAATLELLEALCVALPSIPAPDISPCANGSLDLFWKAPEFTLLMNVHDTNVSWYGERGAFNTKGCTKGGHPDFGFIRELTGFANDGFSEQRK